MKRFLLLKKTVYDLKLVLLREFGFCTGFLCIVYGTGMFDVFGSLCYCYGTPFRHLCGRIKISNKSVALGLSKSECIQKLKEIK